MNFNMKEYSRYLLIIFMVFITLSTSSCGGSVDSLWINANQSNLFTKDCEKIAEAFIAKDKDALLELFCENSKMNSEIDSQIDEAFNYIDGNIVSYGSCGSTGSSASSRDGKVERLASGIVINDIQTDTNEYYYIHATDALIYDENEDYVGITTLKIYHVKDDTKKVDLDDFVEIGQSVDVY